VKGIGKAKKIKLGSVLQKRRKTTRWLPSVDLHIPLCVSLYQNYRGITCCFVTRFSLLTYNLRAQLCYALTLGGAYDGDRNSPVGLQGHVIVAVGGRLTAAAAVMYAIRAEGRGSSIMCSVSYRMSRVSACIQTENSRWRKGGRAR